jgi:hypothetical protein
MIKLTELIHEMMLQEELVQSDAWKAIQKTIEILKKKDKVLLLSCSNRHNWDDNNIDVPKSNKKRTWRGEWVFSIYNLYGRKNAASISFRQNETSGTNEAVRLSIFGIVPGISYNFKM